MSTNFFVFVDHYRNELTALGSALSSLYSRDDVGIFATIDEVNRGDISVHLPGALSMSRTLTMMGLAEVEAEFFLVITDKGRKVMEAVQVYAALLKNT